MEHRSTRFVCLAVLSCLICLFLWGCHNNGHAAATGATDAAPTLNIVAIDRSGSTASMRGAQITTLRAAYARAAKYDEDVSVYVVDSKTACVLPPTHIQHAALNPSVLEELQTPPKDRATKTRPALFWEAMADQFAPGHGKDRVVQILYLTDGDNDWYGEGTRVTAAAAKLAQSPKVNIAILGLDKDAYDSTKKQFAPFGEKRAVYGIGGDQQTLIQGLSRLRESSEDTNQ